MSHLSLQLFSPRRVELTGMLVFFAAEKKWSYYVKVYEDIHAIRLSKITAVWVESMRLKHYFSSLFRVRSQEDMEE